MIRYRTSKWLPIVFVMVLGLINGLIYVFLVPPWQHNDEPNHFEYVWLITQQNKLPSPTDFDAEFNRKVMQSMIAHHFYDELGYLPDLSSTQPVRLPGYSQLGDPPLYYIIAGLPLRVLDILIPGVSVDTKLYATRIASLVFQIVSILAAWLLASELFGPNSILNFLVPFSLALWPGFVDLMTAVSDIVGAVAFFSLFLWFGVRLIHRGFSWQDALGAILMAAACCWTLPSVYIAIPLSVLAFLFAIFRGRWRIFSWAFLLLAGIGFFIALISWGDADLWYRETRQSESTTIYRQDSPLGRNAFQLVVPLQGAASSLFQLIPPKDARLLSGETVTFGAWIWATQPLMVDSPILLLDEGKTRIHETFQVMEIPTFHAITTTLTGDTSRISVALSLPADSTHAGVKVFFDGVVLADGVYSAADPLIFNDSNGNSGTWSGILFHNLVRNSSGEVVGPRVRLWADKRNLIPDYGRTSMILYALRDLPSTGWYYRGAFVNIFRSLWGRFGWNHVSLLGNKPYRVLFLVTLLGILGIGVRIWNHPRGDTHWLSWSWLVLAIFLILATAVARGMIYLLYKIYIPTARYIFPGMIIIVMMLSAGWYELLAKFDLWLPQWIKTFLFISFFVILDVYAVLSLIHFYY